MLFIFFIFFFSLFFFLQFLQPPAAWATVGQPCFSCKDAYKSDPEREFFYLYPDKCGWLWICLKTPLNCSPAVPPKETCDKTNEECDGRGAIPVCVAKGTLKEKGLKPFKNKYGIGENCVTCPANYPVFDAGLKKCCGNSSCGQQIEPSYDDSKCTANDLTCNHNTGLCEDPQMKGLGMIRPLTCNEGKGIDTAIGCVPTDPQELINKLLPWVMGLAGGIAFILMLFGAFQVMTSAGNPEKLKAGQERLTSAIIGLLLIIFSVFLMRIIGLPIMEISK